MEVGERPWGLAVSPDGPTVFTANGPSQDVSFVDVATRTVFARVKAGTGPGRRLRAYAIPVSRDPADQASAFLTYSRHLTTSVTASEPCGTSYSSSIVAGIFHRFIFTVCRMAVSGVSPVPQGRFFCPFAGVVRSFRWKLAMRS